MITQLVMAELEEIYPGLDQSFSTGKDFTPRGNLATFGDILWLSQLWGMQLGPREKKAGMLLNTL